MGDFYQQIDLEWVKSIGTERRNCMRFDEAYSGNVFMGSQLHPEDAQVILYGMPMDWTASYRPGARLGPKRIRESSLVHEEYSHALERDLSEVKYYDAGDIPLPFGNVERSLAKIRQFVGRILAQDQFPFGMGGEHLVTWPIIQQMVKKYPDLVVIHLDAHADLRSEYEGEIYSHATPFYHVAELIGGKRLHQFGIRSMTAEEVAYAREKKIGFYPFEVYKPLQEVLNDLSGKPVYVSIDIDVVDPAYAPGTGTPDPGGISSKELLDSIYAIAHSEVQVVGADVVEVAPAYDPTEQTVILASKLIREMILGFMKSPI